MDHILIVKFIVGLNIIVMLILYSILQKQSVKTLVLKDEILCNQAVVS